VGRERDGVVGEDRASLSANGFSISAVRQQLQ
jgi:hypothetical protein